VEAERFQGSYSADETTPDNDSYLLREDLFEDFNMRCVFDF
jgi:hypothetical protein